MSNQEFRGACATPARRLRVRTLASAVAASLSCWAAGVSAQSLGELYLTAKAYDAAYQSALAQAEATRYKTEQAYAAKRPTIGLKGSVTRQHFDSANDSSGTTTPTTQAQLGQLTGAQASALAASAQGQAIALQPQHQCGCRTSRTSTQGHGDRPQNCRGRPDRPPHPSLL